MATYSFNGNDFEAPDDMKPEDAVKLITSYKPDATTDKPSPTQGEVTPPTATAPAPSEAPGTDTPITAPVTAPPPRVAPTYQPVDGKIDQDTLTHSRDWLDASRILYKKNTGTDFKGTDEDLAQTGLNQMGWFNYNLPAMGMDAAKFHSAKPEEKQAFLYLMDTYDHLGMSWNGSWRMLKGMALDPTTYVGLGSFGLGAAAGQATKLASKAALREALSVGMRTAAEGAMLSTAQDTIKQDVQVDGGAKDSFSYSEMAGAAATGAAFGGVLGGGASVASTALRKAKPWEAAEALRGATETQEAKQATTLADKAPTPASAAPDPAADIVLPDIEISKAVPADDKPKFAGHPLPDRGVAPANKATDGTIFVGEKNSQHFQIAMDHDQEWADTGFVNPDGEFLDRKQAFDWVEANEKKLKSSENMEGMLDSLDYKEQVPNRLRKASDAPKPVEPVVEEKPDLSKPFVNTRNADGDGGTYHPVGVDPDNGKLHGIRYYDKPDGSVSVDFSQTPESSRGKGEGTKMYRDFIDEMHAEGKDVHSDTTVAPSASKIYDKLKSEGYDIRSNPDMQRTPEGGHLSNNDQPAFTAKAPTDSPATQVIKAIREVAADSGGREIPRTFEETAAKSSKAVDILSKTKPEDMPALVEQLRREAVTPEQHQLLADTFARSTTQMTEKSKAIYQEILSTTDATEREALTKQLAQVKSIRDTVQAGDTAMSSMDGRVLNQRKGQANTGDFRETTEDSILAEHGLTKDTASPKAKQWAEDEYFRRYDKWMAKVDQSEVVQQMNKDIQAAYESGDTAQALKLVTDKQSLKESAIRNELQESGVTTKALGLANTALKANNEFIISTVFTTSTLMVNTIPAIVKTLYRPALDMAMRGPADYAAYRQMTSTYLAMAQATPTAMRAAAAAFNYEKALLSSEPNRLLEQDTVFTGRFGRTLRLFPRFLAATDEFFGQINYRGYVMGQAVSDAVEHGHAQGLTGDALEAFVKGEAQKAVDHSFTKDADAPHVIEFLRQTAMDKGYRGAKMETWVAAQLDKNEDLFHTALSQSGKDYGDDLLFKRRFSGENFASKMALGYEGFINRNPIMKMFGQLFFRTPVRVFEDGLRMTPGVNMLDPRLYKDLLGKNGQPAYIRAHGQMFLSYAIASWAVTKYAEGKLTSGGPTDYKQRRDLENTGKWQAYSLHVDDKTVSFRNMDPFSTPMKIIANVMDRMSELEYRKAQGEFVDNHQKEAFNWFKVSVGSIASAVQDANLMSGLGELTKMGATMVDPEKNDTTITRWLASKAQLYIPNQINKVQQQFHPEMPDPVTVEQYLRARINPGDPKVARQYDALGNVRSIAAPMGSLEGLSMASDKQLQRGRSPKELAVLREVSNLEIASGTSFGVMPVKTDKFGLKGQDLRTVYTKDGRTYYDAIMQEYARMPVTNQLHAALVTNKGGTIGTPEHPGTQVTVAKSIIDAYREAALTRVLSHESGTRENIIKDRHKFIDDITGKHDATGLPYR